MQMRRALGCVIGALALTAFAGSNAAVDAQNQAQPNDKHNDEVIDVSSAGEADAAVTGSDGAEGVVSREVQPDGSIASNREPLDQAIGGKEREGAWRVVVNDVDGGVTIDRKSRPQQGQSEGGVLFQEEEYEEEDLLLEPSESFLVLEDRIVDEGYTPKVIAELRTMAMARGVSEGEEDADDWAFATAKLAYMQLFEPDVSMDPTDETAFIKALHDLRIAADAGVGSAQGVVAMLELLNVTVPRQKTVGEAYSTPLTRQETQARAEQTLVHLAGADDFVATLAVGYRLLSGRLPLPRNGTDDDINADDQTKTEAACDAALPFFHTCAETNVHAIADEGGERPVEVVRLSDELVGSGAGGFLDDYGFGGGDPQRDENEALHELEYYRSIANNPLDEQYPEAMQRLGEIHFFGDPAAHVAPDHALAAQYFHQAADAGDPLAQANYGMLLANGMGVDQDVPQALVYFERAAQEGEGFAFHGLGVLYFTGTGVPQNVTLALTYFEEAIALGYAESHSFLGSAYLHGDGGVPVDHALAFTHFQAAVDGTSGQSSQPLFNLAVMHYRGIGTPASCVTALPLFRAVALQPDLLSALPFSLVKAYECYKKGDFLRAYLHYRLVAELGDEDAQCNAAFLLERHGEMIFKWRWLGFARPSESEEMQPLREAFALYSQAAALNDSEAVRKTGACFHEPWTGVCPANRTHALERYRLAAELGDAQAEYNCGLMLLTGDGVPRDLPAARSYYADCSGAGFPANVPCVLVLAGLDAVLALETLVQSIWTAASLQ
ncbi:hypothetical protein BBJ28_00008867 [Nothophytophthora sp. Chile5]|nr:hypothetical protein BBJ28_00008867 [Nothophytophthora sp. Chile5]